MRDAKGFRKELTSKMEAEQKVNFIPRIQPCELCGAGDCAGGALSKLRLVFGYGSRHDGDRVEFAICGECADRLYKDIIKRVRDKE